MPTVAARTADVITQSRAFQAEIRAADDAALKELTRSWKAVRTRLVLQERAYLDRLTAKYGETFTLTPAQLYRTEHLDSLIKQVQAQIDGWAKNASAMVDGSRSLAARMAMEHADAYFALSGFAGMSNVTPILNVAAFESVVARSRTDAVKALFDKMPQAAGQHIRDLIVTGVGTGKNPLLVARDIVKATDMPGWQAARISRTEMMSAYRSSSLDVWRQSQVVQGWVWETAQDERVCAVCWAMEGTVHTMDEDFDTHVQCRCTPIPQTMSWGDLLGSEFADISDAVSIPGGEEAFAGLAQDEQARILGPGRFDLYSGGMPLSDMVRTTSGPVWGGGRELIPLYQLAP